VYQNLLDDFLRIVVARFTLNPSELISSWNLTGLGEKNYANVYPAVFLGISCISRVTLELISKRLLPNAPSAAPLKVERLPQTRC